MFCQRCGAKIKEGEMFCGECGAPVPVARNQSSNRGYSSYEDENRGYGGYQGGRGDAFGDIRNSFGDIQNKVKDRANAAFNDGINTREPKLLFGLKEADGEIPVKQYCCTKLKVPRCHGYLTVTNKRVIFQSKSLSGSSRISQEIPIDSVGAIYCGYVTFIRWILLFIALLFVAGGIDTMFEESFFGGILLVAVGGLLGYLAFQKSFTLDIQSAKAVGDGISVGRGGSGILGSFARFSLIGFAAEDTDMMLQELGAIVQDLQTKGDLAIEKWKN